MRIIGASDVWSLVSMSDAIELMATAFGELSAGRAQAPLRTGIHLDASRLDALTMPATVPAARALGVKLVTVAADNPARNLPLIHATVLIVDPETGQPLGVLDGTSITAMRTGAVSGAATQRLARPDATTLVLFGSGAQAITQALAVGAVRDLKRIVVVGRDQARLDSFAQRLAVRDERLAGLVQTTTDRTAAGDADVICAATTSRVPVFNDADVRPGTHINGVGAYTPAMQEIPADTVVRALVVVDQVEAALEEAGDLAIPIREGQLSPDAVTVELGQLVNGDHPGRTDDQQVTFFKSVGNAVQDMVVGRRALDLAAERGVGQVVSLA
ncbi:MAG TPA: ornithine cyclodeaminase [Thermomicrobiales bacterium]|jgi:ornithine cyclodeaminase|nr:ornithine cyclodeaminase [Thermomicrobiales bacterium]